ncbi:MAG: hypothetical protein LBR47_03890, partial [Spirochaetaceae bacterium]|nr:hypothetical protein [Spirochaetaceae bacterium]
LLPQELERLSREPSCLACVSPEEVYTLNCLLMDAFFVLEFYAVRCNRLLDSEYMEFPGETGSSGVESVPEGEFR